MNENNKTPLHGHDTDDERGLSIGRGQLEFSKASQQATNGSELSRVESIVVITVVGRARFQIIFILFSPRLGSCV